MSTIDTMELAVLVLGMVILMWDNRFQDGGARVSNSRPSRRGSAHRPR
ncbi:MAG TPA: hypothetical protein VF720_08385 [Candidatus Eisenbacteria bacterium]